MPLERCALNPPHQIKSRSNISKSRSATFFSLNVVTHDKHRPITSEQVHALAHGADFNRMLSSDQSSYVWYAAGLS